MYYEEKVINGILFYRTDPDKEWIEMSKEDLTARYIRTKNDNCVYAQLYEGWRDVRKELPTVDYEVYLVYDKEGSMGLAHYLGGCIFGGWPGVIAWMPLPSPPVFV